MDLYIAALRLDGESGVWELVDGTGFSHGLVLVIPAFTNLPSSGEFPVYVHVTWQVVCFVGGASAGAVRPKNMYSVLGSLYDTCICA